MFPEGQHSYLIPGRSRPNCTATRRPWPPTEDRGGGLDDLEVATCRWVSWFNEERIHSTLQDRTPAEVEGAYYRDHLTATRRERSNRQSLHQTQADSK